MPPHSASASQYGRPLNKPGVVTTLSRLSIGIAGAGGSGGFGGGLRRVACASASVAPARMASASRPAVTIVLGIVRLLSRSWQVIQKRLLKGRSLLSNTQAI